MNRWDKRSPTLTPLDSIAKPSGWLVLMFLWAACSMPNASGADRLWTDSMLVDAIQRAGQGYSSDEILVRQSLRAAVRSAVEDAAGAALDEDDQSELWLRMLNLRKAGKLTVPTTRRGKPVNDQVIAMAELAARAVIDRHRVTTDRILADPRLRHELQAEAELIEPGVDADEIRKAVLSLRKRRALKPELVLKVTQWGRVVETHALEDLRMRLAAGDVSRGPGVYLFRSHEGYLYVGEAADLAARLTQHLGGSDRPSLADFLAQDSASVTVELHRFAEDSPAKQVAFRRAYESELIRSRHPRFNLRP